MNSTTAHTQKESRIGSSPLMMRWISAMLFMIMLVAGGGGLRTAHAITQAQIDTAIDNGMRWMLAQQNANGSFSTDGYYAANTGFAVAAMEHDAEKQGKTPLGTYANKTALQNGLNYLFTNAVYDSSIPASGGTTTAGGIYWNIGGDDAYQSGIPLMAIARSGTPDAVVTGLNASINGKTYREVAQMAVNWLVSAQGTSGGYYYTKASKDSAGDQSATGWAVMGVGYAVNSMGCTVSSTWKTNMNTFNTYIQQTSGTVATGLGGSGYTTPTSYVNAYKTGHLLYDMALVGTAKSDSKVTAALNFLDYHWGDQTSTYYSSGGYGWRGNPAGGLAPGYTAMFSMSKGFSEYGIENFGTGPHDWYNDFATVIVNNQLSGGTNMSYWLGGNLSDQVAIRGTAHALLVLVRAQSFLPPVVSSSAATNITTTSATVNGNLTSMGSSTSVDVTFQYGTSPGIYTQETAVQTFTSTSPFTVTLSNLALNTTFYYRSKAVGTTSGTPTGTGYSAEISFTTPSTLTYFPAIANGTATPASYTNIPFPNDYTARVFDFTANTGYHLTGITSPCAGTATPAVFPYTNNTSGVTTASFSVATPAVTSCVVTAATAANVYTITASATDNNGSAGVGGSISCPATVNYGIDPTCTFTPTAGYHVYDVIVDGSSAWNNYSAIGVNTTLDSRALGIIAAPRTVLVKFRKNTYLISTTTPDSHGTIIPTNGYGDYGINTLTVSANTGYYITTITDTCGGAGYTNVGPDYGVTSRSYPTGSISGACSVTANFALGYRYITTSVPSGNGTLSCVSPVINGTDSLCTMSPSTGYHLSTLTVAGTSVYTNPGNNTTLASYTITAVGADKAVVANFAINTYSVAANPGTNGTVTGGASGATVTRTTNYGGSETFTFNANSGYHITDISGCGGPAYSPAYTNGTSGVTSYSYTSGTITSDCTISATTAGNQFNVTATPDAHSKVDSYALNTAHVYTGSYSGSNQVTFSTETGYHLTAVTNSCSGTASATYYNANNGPWTTSVTFTASGTIADGAAPNCTITATSAINVYTITPGIATVP